MENYVVPVDMRERRRANRLTQQDVAQRLYITRIHANRIENGARPLTIDIALDLVDLFGGLTVERAGRKYIITSDSGAPAPSPKTRRVPSDGMTLGEKIVRVGKEGRELLAKTIKVNQYLVLLHRNPEAAAEFGGEITKELADVLAWGEDLMISLHETFDAVYHEAEARSIRELEAEMGVSA